MQAAPCLRRREGGGASLASGGAGEAVAVAPPLAVRLRFVGDEGEAGPGQPGVSPGLQRRLRLRRVHEWRRGRHLLLATGGRPPTSGAHAHPCRGDQGGLRRTAPVDPADPAAPARRTAAAEEDGPELAYLCDLQRLPEIQQLVRSLTVENDGLREEMKALQGACTALSKENSKLETRLEQSSKRSGIKSEEQQRKPQLDQPAAEQDAQNGFVLPDLNLPVQDIADGSAAP